MRAPTRSARVQQQPADADGRRDLDHRAGREQRAARQLEPQRRDEFQTLDTFGGAVVPPAAMLHPGVRAAGRASIGSTSGAANVFFDDGPNAANMQRQINIVNALLLTKGRHQMKFGVDYRRLLPIYDPVDYVQAYTFDGVAGALAGTALVAASPRRRRTTDRRT